VTPTSFDSVIVGKRSLGEPCATASDKDTCQQDLNNKLSRLTESEALVIQKGGDSAVVPLSGVSSLFFPVDAPDKALAILMALGKEEAFCKGYISRDGVKFETQQSLANKDCASIRTITVTSTGTINEGREGKICKGRRPEGLHELTTSNQSSLGAFLACAAWEEAASVPAFHLLARDLMHLEAPAPLIERALASAEDEVRHAEQMASLAERFGAQAETSYITTPRPKPLLDLAIENMREGCINETFAALLALYQAENAADPMIAEVMQRIAHDEAQHAMLAWEIHEWALPRLSEKERKQLQETQQHALQLLSGGQSYLSNDDATRLGWPNPVMLASLASALRAELACV
jgi:hypothetical protein